MILGHHKRGLFAPARQAAPLRGQGAAQPSRPASLGGSKHGRKLLSSTDWPEWPPNRVAPPRQGRRLPASRNGVCVASRDCALLPNSRKTQNRQESRAGSVRIRPTAALLATERDHFGGARGGCHSNPTVGGPTVPRKSIRRPAAAAGWNAARFPNDQAGQRLSHKLVCCVAGIYPERRRISFLCDLTSSQHDLR